MGRRIAVTGIPGQRLVRGYDDERARVKASRKWYNSKGWRQRRAVQLATEPLCAMCLAEGLAVEATVADHVEPHREDWDKFWHGGLQSLCAGHHSRAKQSEEAQKRGGGSRSGGVG